MAKLVNAFGLKPNDLERSCGFESRHRHQFYICYNGGNEMTNRMWVFTLIVVAMFMMAVGMAVQDARTSKFLHNLEDNDVIMVDRPLYRELYPEGN